jgi:protein SCO1/2
MLVHARRRTIEGRTLRAVLALLAVLAFAGRDPRLLAQMTGAPAPGYRQSPGIPAATMPPPLREIGFDQHLDQRVPLDVELTDESGRTVRLGEYFGRRPVVLAFVYYECPMLCTQVLSSLTSSLKLLSLSAGEDFDVVTVSFDARETPAQAAARKAAALERYDRPNAASGWHFLTGAPESIERLTRAAGFRYVWDEPTQQFAHPTGIIVLTPDGRLARYLFGIDYGARDLRLAIVEASEGAVGSAVDALVLFCYHYDPMTGRYGFLVMRALRIAGAATVLAIGSLVFVMIRREKRLLRDPRDARSVVR